MELCCILGWLGYEVKKPVEDLNNHLNSTDVVTFFKGSEPVLGILNLTTLTKFKEYLNLIHLGKRERNARL